MLSGMLALVWIVVIAMRWNEGMWNNCLALVNVVLSALLAMNFWEPAADFLESKLPSYTFLMDYLALWGVFALSYMILRQVTAALSDTRVKFSPPIETAGSIISVILTGWVMVCFSLTTLHTSPLARTAVRGTFQAEPMSNNFLGTAPDRMWLGYVQHRSKYALSNPTPTVFDERGEFVFKYGQRRELLSGLEGLRVDTKGR